MIYIFLNITFPLTQWKFLCTPPVIANKSNKFKKFELFRVFFKLLSKSNHTYNVVYNILRMFRTLNNIHNNIRIFF